MKMQSVKLLIPLLAVALIGSWQPLAKADPTSAEDDAYKMAVTYAARGFAMAPTNNSGVGGSGYTVRFLVPVSKGVDYVFLCGMDAFVERSGIYVYDEVGSLILDDRRGMRRSGVQFRSSYNGTVQVYLNIAHARGMGAYSVLVGRRGEERHTDTTESATTGSTQNVRVMPGA